MLRSQTPFLALALAAGIAAGGVAGQGNLDGSIGGGQAGPQNSTCASVNGAGGTLNASGYMSNNAHFALKAVAPVPLKIVGYELLCVADTPISIATALYTADASGLPLTTAARTSTLGVQMTADFRRTTFPTPLDVASGATFFLGLKSPSVAKMRTILTGGTPAPYHASSSTPPAWGSLIASWPMAWRVICYVDGEYVAFGPGCLGTGKGSGTYSESLNANATANGMTVWLHEQFVHAVDIARDETIDGFSFLMSHGPGSITIDAFVYAATASGAPALTPLRQGKMQVTASASWARSSFLPLDVKKGQRLYIGYKVPDDHLRTECGTFGEPSTYYWDGPAWKGPFTAMRAAFRLHSSPAVALNPFATTPGSGIWAKGAHIAHQVEAQSDTWIDGFAFRCSLSVPGNVETFLYRALPDGKPAKTALRSSTMTASATLGWAETRFPRAFFAKGERLFLGYRVPVTGDFIADNGGSGELTTHYAGGPAVWNGPFQTVRTSWRVSAAPWDGRNTDQETLTPLTGNAGWFAAGPFTATSSDEEVERFSWLTSATAEVKATGYVVLANANGTPMDIAVRSGEMQIGTTPGFHTCSFEPLRLLTGTRFFVVLQVPASMVRLIAAAGSTSTVYFSPSSPLTWSGYSGRVAVKVYCKDRGSPMLGGNGVPAIGSTFAVTLTGARHSTAAALILGVSRTQWGPLPLPLGLGFAGAPDCALLASYDMLLPVPPVDPYGNAAVSIALPNDVGLVGARFYNQFLVYDPNANALKFVLSNGGAAKIGG